MYFYLNKNCFFIPGSHNSAIYNLSDGNLYSLDCKETQLLIQSEQGIEIDDPPHEIFHHLTKKHLGFLSDSKCFVEKERLYSPYLHKRLDLGPLNIHTAYIKLTNLCNTHCQICHHSFCPICFCDDSLSHDELGCDEWMGVIAYLSKMNLKQIYFTGGDPFIYKHLDKLTDYALSKGLTVNIVTSGRCEIPSTMSHDAHIILTAYEPIDYEPILFPLTRFHTVSVLYTHDIVGNAIKQLDIPDITVQKISPTKTIYSLKDLQSFDTNSFFSRKDFDSCLHGKVFFDHKGNVIPCFQGYKKVLGNIRHTKLDMILDKLVENYWQQPISNDKCSTCELYYACTSCKFFNPDKECHYDIAKGVFTEL